MPRKRGRLPTKATPTTRRKESKMVAPNPVYPPETAPEGPFAPYYSEDGTCILWWSCHGYLVRPEGDEALRLRRSGAVHPRCEAETPSPRSRPRLSRDGLPTPAV